MKIEAKLTLLGNSRIQSTFDSTNRSFPDDSHHPAIRAGWQLRLRRSSACHSHGTWFVRCGEFTLTVLFEVIPLLSDFIQCTLGSPDLIDLRRDPEPGPVLLRLREWSGKSSKQHCLVSFHLLLQNLNLTRLEMGSSPRLAPLLAVAHFLNETCNIQVLDIIGSNFAIGHKSV